MMQPVKTATWRRGGVAFAILFPTVLTLVYFVALADLPTVYQQLTYTIGKCIQFAFPFVWVGFVLGQRVDIRALFGFPADSVLPSNRVPMKRARTSRSAVQQGVVVGTVFAVLVCGAMLALYFFWLRSSEIVEPLESMVWQKVSDLGLTHWWSYAAVGLFYSLLHSLLEEYYWRWFLFGQLRRTLAFGAAMILSSVAFMAHHVILLATFLGWSSPLSYLLSAAVAVGGMAWAFIYEEGRSLVGPWLSHMAVDAAIFLIGYDLVRHQLG